MSQSNETTKSVTTPVLFEVGNVKITRDHAYGAAIGVLIAKLLSS